MLRAGWPPGARFSEWSQSFGSGALWGTLGRLGWRGRFGGRGGKRLGSGVHPPTPPPPSARGALQRPPRCAFPAEDGGRGSSGVGPAPGRQGLWLPRAPGGAALGDRILVHTGGGGGPLLDFPARPGSGRAGRGRGRDTTVVGNSGCRGRPPQ